MKINSIIRGHYVEKKKKFVLLDVKETSRFVFMFVVKSCVKLNDNKLHL